MIDASKECDAGGVFGYLAVTEERSIFSQNVWAFQDRLPAIASRYVLTLPSGWTAKTITFNHPKIQPTISRSTYTCELLNLPPIAPAPSTTRISRLSPPLPL